MAFEKDHEFPWIEADMYTREMKCVCGAKGRTDDWIAFLTIHQRCEPKEKTNA